MSPDPSPDPLRPRPEFPESPRGAPSAVPRLVALLEVFICSDFPTQLAIGSTLGALGFDPLGANGRLQVGHVIALSLLDSAVLIGLIVLFLRSHGERPTEVFFGRRSIKTEAVHGLPLVLVALAIAIGALLLTRYVAPSLHTVERNPLQDLLGSTRDAWLFALVVLVAGGVREEIQRAFLLHRFEQWLGGGIVGLTITSAAFGAGHLIQGADAALATGLLGAFWGIVYLRRRSAVAPMVSHAGFDLAQILQFLVAGR